MARPEGYADGHDRGDPNQVGQGVLEIELLLAAEQGLAEDVVHEVGNQGREDHEDTHGEDPDDQLAAHDGVVGQGQGQEGDERDARDAVGLEAVRRGADRVTRIVAGAVRDDAGIFGIVFRKVEDDLHEVGTDVGDLGEDTPADSQRAGAEGLADGEADEAGTGQFHGEVGQNEDHKEELDADQQQSHAHAGAEADVDDIQGLAAQGREGGAGIGDRVDPDAEPGHAVGAEDSHDRAEKDHQDGADRVALQADEVIDDADGDQDPEAGEELPLLEQIGLAGLPDRVGDVQHGPVGGQVFRLGVLHPAESHSDQADEETDIQNGESAEGAAHEADLGQIGELDIRLTGEGHRGHQKQDDGERTEKRPETAFSDAHDSTLLA